MNGFVKLWQSYNKNLRNSAFDSAQLSENHMAGDLSREID